MTDPTALDSQRRLIEQQYGRPIRQLRYDTIPHPDHAHDPVLSALLHRYTALHQTENHLDDVRRRLRRLLDEGQDSTTDGTALLVRTAQDLHALTVRHGIETHILGDLLSTRPQPAHQAAPAPLDASPDTGPAGGVDDLLPLARRIAADSPRLTRDLLGTALRSHGIRVSNRRVRALVDRLRAEAVLGTAA